MLARRKLGNLQRHVGVLFTEAPYQITEKACRDRREDANPQMTILAATCRPSSLDRIVELSECGTCAIEKPGSCRGNPYAAMVSLEKRYAERVLQ